MKKILVFAIGFLFPFVSLAQFSGSSGDGHDESTVVWVGLNGVPGSSNVIYFGGNGEGFISGRTAAFVGGGNNASFFQGGRGDGYAHFQTAGFVDGTEAAQLYAGNNGDGFALSSSSSFVNGESGESLYSGNDGDGFALAKYGGFLNNVSIWKGGLGDGHNLARYGGFLETVLIYGGGAGDGITFSLFSGEFPEEGVVGIIDEFQGDVDNTIEFDLYPNPTVDNVIHIKLENLNSTSIEIKIIDLSGRVVMKKSVDREQSAGRFKVKGLQKLSAGTYIIGVAGNDFKASKVLIISR